jgi:hypothetical protein
MLGSRWLRVIVADLVQLWKAPLDFVRQATKEKHGSEASSGCSGEEMG